MKRIKLFVVFGILLFVVSIGYGLKVNILDAQGVNPFPGDFGYDSNQKYYSGQFVIEVCNESGGNVPEGNVGLVYHVGDFAAAVDKSEEGGYLLLPLSSEYNKNGEKCRKTSDYFMTMGTAITSSDNWSFAIFPSYLWVVLSQDDKVSTGSDNQYLFVGTSPAFSGSYSFSVNNFDPQTGYLIVTLNSFTTPSGTFTSIPSSANNEHSLVTYGICSDSHGSNCASSELARFNDTVGHQISLYTGHPNMDDQQVYTVYYVVNGMGYPIKLGANLVASISAPDTVYWGQKVPVTVTIRNIGNVNVTTDFTVELIYNESGNVKTFDKTVIDDIPANGGEITVTFDEPWKFDNVGSGQIKVIVDSNNNINETNENDNSVETDVTLLPSYNLSVVSLANGDPIYVFPNSKLPYKVKITVYEQPGNVAVSKTIYLVEENGTVILDPEKDNGIRTIVELNIPSSGLETTIVPTKKDENYKLYFTGLKFYNGIDVVDTWPLDVSSTSDDFNVLSGVANPNSAIFTEVVNIIGRVYYHLFMEMI